MARYYWEHVDTVEDLTRRYNMGGVLNSKALTLLKRGLPIEVGEMYYRGAFRYRLRYQERTDYTLTRDDLDTLRVEQNGRTAFWVMGHCGSVHSAPHFTTLESAQAYLDKRKEEQPR